MPRVLPLLVLATLWGESAGACLRVDELPSPEALVARASVIVVATAVRHEIAPAGPVRGLIEFHVESVLRGDGLLPARGRSPLLIEGTLVTRDDFNEGPSPYHFVRPDGRHGSCFAYQYRQGARFLLLLNRTPNGSLTPYWEPLAPTNEQLREGDDAWLGDVRRFATGVRHQ